MGYPYKVVNYIKLGFFTFQQFCPISVQGRKCVIEVIVKSENDLTEQGRSHLWLYGF